MQEAVIQTGGKQYRVTVGSELEVEKIEAKEGEKIEINQVLMVFDEKELILGEPFIEEVKIIAEVLAHTQEEKIRVARFKSKKRYSRVTGHRHDLTKLRIKEIKEIKVKNDGKNKTGKNN